MMDDVDEDDSSWFWQHIFYQLLWIQLNCGVQFATSKVPGISKYAYFFHALQI